MSPPKKRLDDPRNALGGTNPLVNDGGKDLWGGNANPRPVDPLLVVVEALLDHFEEHDSHLWNLHPSEVRPKELLALARSAVAQHEEKNRNREATELVSEIIKNPKEPYTVEDFHREHKASFDSPATGPAPWPELPFTRRERYAMAAMQGLLSNPVELAKFRTLCINDEESLEDYLAGMCLIIADAMLTAGRKQ